MRRFLRIHHILGGTCQVGADVIDYGVQEPLAAFDGCPGDVRGDDAVFAGEQNAYATKSILGEAL